MDEKLRQYCSSNALPMHMPGHKRNSDVIAEEFSCDITEIDGFDNLQNPTGIIKDMMDQACRIFNSDEAYISVNGSSALLMAAVMASDGKSILVASNCHISIWRGIELSGKTPVTINPEIMPEGFYGSISPDLIDKTLTENPEVKALVLTSPTYEGVMSDIEKIVEIAHAHEAIVILDAAHGAHLNLKADIVIKSLHKTLNSPTQTAIMLQYGKRIPGNLLKHYVNMFQSTSPSYMLMSGIAGCLKTYDEGKIQSWKNLVLKSKSELSKMTKLSLFDYSPSDFSKIIILTNGYITGYKLADILREKYKIELEAAFSNYVIAMTGIGDTEISLKRFVDALLLVDKDLKDEISSISNCSLKEINHSFAMPFNEALRSDKCLISLDEATDLISGEYIFAYPPGIPVVLPGEILNRDKIDELKIMLQNKTELKTDPYRTWDGCVFTVDTNRLKQV